jgi:hypothetical protein
VLLEFVIGSVAVAQTIPTVPNPQAVVPVPVWETISFWLGAAGILGSIFNFFYTRAITRRHRTCDRRVATFTSLISTPVENELVNLEESERALRAILVQSIHDRRAEARAELETIQKEKLNPTFQKLETILGRADAHEAIGGIDWTEFASDRIESIQNLLDRASSAARPDNVVTEAINSAASGIAALCADLRNRISVESERLSVTL